MAAEIKRLGDAELEIMQAVWGAGEAVNSAYIQAALAGKRNWSSGALGTALNRLCEKGFLACEKRGWNNFYTPLVRQSDYLWGDRIFEKCGIGRDEGGDGGKTLEIRGKRRLSARDGGANYQQS